METKKTNSYTIQKEEDPERYGVWFDNNRLLVMLQVMEEEPMIIISETKGSPNTPKSKLKVLWSGSIKEFLEQFGANRDRLNREKAFNNFIKLYVYKKNLIKTR